MITITKSVIVDNGKWLKNKCFRDKPEVNDKKNNIQTLIFVSAGKVFTVSILYHDLCSFSQTWTFEIRNINDFYMDINT